jgi:hypothetical protein
MFRKGMVSEAVIYSAFIGHPLSRSNHCTQVLLVVFPVISRGSEIHKSIIWVDCRLKMEILEELRRFTV